MYSRATVPVPISIFEPAAEHVSQPYSTNLLPWKRNKFRTKFFRRNDGQPDWKNVLSLGISWDVRRSRKGCGAVKEVSIVAWADFRW